MPRPLETLESKIDQLLAALANVPTLKVPTALNAYAVNLGAAVGNSAGVKSTNTSSTTYITVDSVTGSGVLEHCSAATNNAAAFSVDLRITLDGAVVFTGSSNAVQFSVVCPVGAAAAAGAVGLSVIPFKSSLLIEAKVGSATQTGVVKTKYYLT